uniref:Reverse transcriptase domain-containing protein n=1 Tax=Tanacetum cinerariifolium TaxID=118510 RepID=A0A6L2JMB3_TANCI|nr:hypothetical protein [Tanacetum cinerariifolium]
MKNLKKTIIKIKEMRNEVSVNGAAVIIPMEAVESVNACFVNTLYGYFIGDRLAFPLVENYVKSTWAKYGLKRIQLHEEFFLFQFNTKEGMESVMENGPWLIRRVPLLLNEWTTNTILKKDEIKREGHTFATIDIEYEWTPPRCAFCRIFDHVSEKCPKFPKVASNEKVIDDGFIEVKKKKTNTKKKSKKQVEGVRLNKPTPNLQYRRVDKGKSSKINNRTDTNLKDEERVNAGYQILVEYQFVNDSDEDVDEYIIMEETSKAVHKVKPKGMDGILCKLDRVLANLEFLDVFMGAHAVFKPYRISDHSFAVLSIPSLVKEKPMPFKIFNVVILDDRFKDVIRNAWMAKISGFYMFRMELDKVQTDLDSDPNNLSFREKEAAMVADFNEALLMEEKFLKQKAKITWLKEGDFNTAYFHKVVKSRVSRSRIDVVTDAYCNVHHSIEVAKAFINHYEISLSQEVKSAMFSMGNDKSPGPDGFTAAFFKDTWDIIGVDVIKAVKEFFINGRLLKELNHTIIALIPKLIFKKRMTRLIGIFLRVILIGFGFHERMIAWIMECVTTTSFSISINGSLHGYFDGKRGLRQGDPFSPYLFTLIMEVFTLMIKRRVREASTFTYHRFCSELDLINLCFADDLFLFAHGDVNSAKVIKDALDDFKDASGLNLSMPKSKAYFCNVINYTKLAIVNVLPFEEDRLPVKYLGVPLVSSRLISRDCKELIDKLLSLKESLWVKRIHIYKLKNRSFWDISYRGKMSWSWRKLLLIRPLIREFIWSCIGDGRSTSMWFDKWCVASPLSNIISSRDITRAGFNHASKNGVVEMIAGLKGAGPSLASIITHLMPISKRKSSKSCIGAKPHEPYLNRTSNQKIDDIKIS